MPCGFTPSGSVGTENVLPRKAQVLRFDPVPMTILVYLIPVALFLGAVGLGGFLWALRSGQYEDLDGAAERILIDREDRRFD